MLAALVLHVSHDCGTLPARRNRLTSPGRMVGRVSGECGDSGCCAAAYQPLARVIFQALKSLSNKQSPRLRVQQSKTGVCCRSSGRKEACADPPSVRAANATRKRIMGSVHECAPLRMGRRAGPLHRFHSAGGRRRGAWARGRAARRQRTSAHAAPTTQSPLAPHPLELVITVFALFTTCDMLAVQYGCQQVGPLRRDGAGCLAGN